MIDFTTLPPHGLQTLLNPPQPGGLSHIKPVSGIWYRAIQLKFMTTALQYKHTRIQTSRFGAGTPTAPAHSLLYFAENQHVALLEVLAVFSPPGSAITLANPSLAWATLNVTVKLSQVADLTSVAVQQALQTTAQELTGDWIGYQLRTLPSASVTAPIGIAPTQELGAALYGMKSLQGFLIPSAKAPERKNLVIFPNRISAYPADFVQFVDPATSIIHRIPSP